MQSKQVPFSKTGYFSSLICDYINQKPELEILYNRFPSLENFKLQIQEKSNSEFTNQTSRDILVDVLKEQYSNIDTSELTSVHIESLKLENTFTITTGHQLNLFTGPLYFLYKIISTINLTTRLKQEYPEYNFVPVYWMATEDHDFEEINYFNFKGKKIHWEKNASGAVGVLDTDGLKEVLDLFALDLGHTKNADYLTALFKKAYVEHKNLTDATRYLANELFKSHGLVIIDAADKALKREFIPFVKDELLNQTSFQEVSKTIENINTIENQPPYGIQVNPREINLFYIKDNLRERIVFEEGVFKVLNTDIVWNENEILAHASEVPERFSPNVVMRPLYQEVILPNLCYIGGGGELAYWFQLKGFFDAVKVSFPILLLRNSVLIQTEKQAEKLKKLNISSTDVFLERDTFINKKVREISNIDIDFSPQKKHLKAQFEDLYQLAEQTDTSFLGAVKAQEVKQIKGLEHLEKRLLKAQKRKLADEVSRMTDIKNELFPNQGLQERNTNFSEFYLEYGDQLIPSLVDNLDPLNTEFTILTL
ncbi:bacillithiol biosynthesis cysteine-adding enzyme BshC [Flavobacteriaceae bacterium XHP0103]|uniref:bacillithiol biosynthesis cysteine-adding enzyme BshC n=1 Tax=Marixanthotalea marina TaxID=2844359 RepID=UPI002989E852|nr:bacillithiol biosynthesis cysteine-adding enzyme BshC [Marixanthotalea marina]MBU3821278.1 bacillithiol biosynthesis cysteine-adding enzyme BshC [Marixanthotalea marina]